MSELFDPEQQKVIDRVEKLLRLAARNTSAEEAASATAKAQELLAAYNLSMGDINEAEDKSAVREQMKIKGGMYEFQRDVYRAVAHLNFCLYWTVTGRKWVERNKVDPWTGQKYTKHVLSRTFQHMIVGRLVNTRSTRMMSEYLTQTIERLVSERYSNSQRWMREAVAYREGIADVIVNRLYARRANLDKEEAAKRKAEFDAKGVSTSNALTLAQYSDAEFDANMDVIYGEGCSARQAAARAERARKNKEAEQAYTAWAAENPEEAAKLEKEREKERAKQDKRRARRGATTERDKRSWSSEYWQGREVGETVSIDPQVSDRPASATKRIGR